MKYFYLILLLNSCSAYPIKYTGIVHNYVIKKARYLCESHGGLWYIVSSENIIEEGKNKDYPCREFYKIRCQDEFLWNLNDEVAWCFIDKDQIEDSLK